VARNTAWRPAFSKKDLHSAFSDTAARHRSDAVCSPAQLTRQTE
jgi:hypothetical protein